MTRRRPTHIRCAIYTRKSSDEGLEQDFNSLDAQHEACSAYITSQKAEGWVEVATVYDDAGLSGGTLERPALQRLLSDIAARKVNRIVVYKIDRLTRSLSDFAKIVETLDAHDASFVSVTQAFNTATSMGRLTLNMLLSFAQFEREVTAERIRDKIAASKAKGLWMGGTSPFGYTPEGRSLAIVEDEAAIVRHMFDLYMDRGTQEGVAVCCEALSYRTRVRPSGHGKTTGGVFFTKSHIHAVLTNPVYAGKIRHKDQVYEGQHDAIVPQEQWERVQTRLTSDARRLRGATSQNPPSPLKDKLFDARGERLTPSHSTKAGKRYRYYLSKAGERSSKQTPPMWRLSAPRLERIVTALMIEHFSRPAAELSLCNAPEAYILPAITAHLADLVGRCKTTYPNAQWSAIVDRVDLAPDHIRITLSPELFDDNGELEFEGPDDFDLEISAPLTLRRRGVETRLQIGLNPVHPDPVLAANILKARRWYAELCAGKSAREIRAENNVGETRFSQVLQLAFLAPDLLERIAAGTQPATFTSQYVKAHGLPAEWDAQRALFNLLA
ncbi:MAG: recombinase family protein [Pseudomonadota bacterium]